MQREQLSLATKCSPLDLTSEELNLIDQIIFFFLDQGYIQPTCSQAHYLEGKGDCTKIFISCDQGMILYVGNLNLEMNWLNLDIK